MSTPAFPAKIADLIRLSESLGPQVAALASHVIDLPGFSTCSGSASEGHHHYGTCGLQWHTWQVVNLCAVNRVALSIEQQVSAAAAFLAPLFHDVGKLWDYQRKPDPMGLDLGWEETPHKRLINHVNRSAIYWVQCATEAGCSVELREEVLHAILAHHAEFGSSVMPKTKLAWLLHLCDSMSAWMDQCDRREPVSK